MSLCRDGRGPSLEMLETGMKSDEMQSDGCLLEAIRLVIDSGHQIIDRALAHDARQASITLDNGVVNLDDHFGCEIDHGSISNQCGLYRY